MTLRESVQMIDAFFRVDLQRGSSCGFCRLPRELCIKSAKERISAQAPWGDTANGSAVRKGKGWASLGTLTVCSAPGGVEVMGKLGASGACLSLGLLTHKRGPQDCFQGPF